jgi:hypothetical protein
MRRKLLISLMRRKTLTSGVLIQPAIAAAA